MRELVIRELQLYGTSACHLCEQAEALLLPWVAQGWQVELIDIAEGDDLIERYGVRIPVLADGNGRELFWPFDAESLQDFLQSPERDAGTACSA